MLVAYTKQSNDYFTKSNILAHLCHNHLSSFFLYFMDINCLLFANIERVALANLISNNWIVPFERYETLRLSERRIPDLVGWADKQIEGGEITYTGTACLSSREIKPQKVIRPRCDGAGR